MQANTDATHTPSTSPKVLIPSGNSVDTSTARLAPMARWSSFNLSFQALFQALVFLVSQMIDPQLTML